MRDRKDTASLLKLKGVSPSLQRIAIYNYLAEKRNHPTVEMIYKELLDEIPTLSKTTVYNTLKTFVNNRLAIEILIDKNEIRYDADTSIHGHFYCERCGIIHDFTIDSKGFTDDLFDHAEIHEHHIYFRGVCNNAEFKEVMNISA